jgi:hypothetical protein
MADVVVVDVHVDEAAQLAFGAEQMRAELRVRVGQRAQERAHGGPLRGDDRLLPREGAQRRWNENTDRHHFSLLT